MTKECTTGKESGCQYMESCKYNGSSTFRSVLLNGNEVPAGINHLPFSIESFYKDVREGTMVWVEGDRLCGCEPQQKEMGVYLVDKLREEHGKEAIKKYMKELARDFEEQAE